MYIRRKVYSIPAEQEEYDMEERLYSTGDYELDEILERAFCEGYEYAQKEFTDDDDDDVKLSRGDRFDIWSNKHLMSHKARQQMIDEENDDQTGSHKTINETAKKEFKYGVPLTSGVGATIGAVGMALNTKNAGEKDKVKIAKNILKGAAGGGIAGAGASVLFAGADAVSDRLATDVRRKARKNNKSYDEYFKKSADRYRVADGQMTKKEYKDKWYK